MSDFATSSRVRSYCMQRHTSASHVRRSSVGATVDRWYGSSQVDESARVARFTTESFYREHEVLNGKAGNETTAN
jgi:hypothetical protein